MSRKVEFYTPCNLAEIYGTEIEIKERISLKEFLEEFQNYKNECNMVSCRYNRDGICKNEEKRKECVDVSKLVLCLEG